MAEIPLITLEIVRADRSDFEHFPEDANAFMAQLPDLADQQNALAQGVNAVLPLIEVAAGAAASGAAPAYDPATPYAFPAIVAGSDGHTYRCTKTPGTVTGDNPAGSATGNWVRISGYPYESKTFRNLIINGDFRVHQRGTVGTFQAGAYCLDRWKAGASGAQVFTGSDGHGLNVLTINSGSLQQVIEAKSVPPGSHTLVLSWQGTSQGKINGGAYGASGLTAAITDGGIAPIAVEFSAGTLAKVQLEIGTAPTPFELIPYGLALRLCQRYFCRLGGASADDILAFGYATSGTGGRVGVCLPVSMRAVPVIENTITPANYSIFVGGAASQPLTSLALSGAVNSTAHMVSLDWASAGPWTAGHGCALGARNTLSGHIDFSAEL